MENTQIYTSVNRLTTYIITLLKKFSGSTAITSRRKCEGPALYGLCSGPCPVVLLRTEQKPIEPKECACPELTLCLQTQLQVSRSQNFLFAPEPESKVHVRLSPRS